MSRRLNSKCSITTLVAVLLVVVVVTDGVFYDGERGGDINGQVNEANGQNVVHGTSERDVKAATAPVTLSMSPDMLVTHLDAKNVDSTHRPMSDLGGTHTADIDVLRLATRRDRFLFASFTTSTRRALSIVTSTTLFTCISAPTASAACTGRRRKKTINFNAKMLFSSGTTLLDPGAALQEEPGPRPAVGGANGVATRPEEGAVALDSSIMLSKDVTDDLSLRRTSARTFLTVWSTVSSTSTVTVFTVNMSTTVSIAELCSLSANTLSTCAG